MKRFGDNIRLIERNLEREVIRKDIISLNSKLFCHIESESQFNIIHFLNKFMICVTLH